MSAVRAPGRFGPGGDLRPSGAFGGGGSSRNSSERIYGGMLRLYPAAFRARYQDEMVQLFTDQLRDARSTSGARGATATWFRMLPDLASNAIGEHLRKDRDVAQSLSSFESSRTMRLLGLLAVVGGLLLLWAFISWNPFAERAGNTVRLVLFGLTGAAVGLAFHDRQATVARRPAVVATGVVVIAGVWYTTWILLTFERDSPFAGMIGLIGSLASFALWTSAAVYGGISLRVGALWRGMTPRLAAVARMATVALALGGLVAWIGDDRWGFIHDEDYGALIQQAAVLGVFLVGAGWVLLGALLALGGRGARRTA